MMRAIRVRKFGGVEQMKLETDVPIPSVEEKQILVKLNMSGVNPVDTYLRSGQYARLPTLPYVPGKDGAGLVHAVGANVSKFKVGDRVFCSQTVSSGTLGQFTAMDETHVFPLGDRLSFEQGAGIGIPYFTAFRALFQKAEAKPGCRVLVHGASGAVGLAAVQIAKANGMYVTGTAGTQEGLDMVKAQGADFVYNHRERGYLNQIQEGEKFDVILEMLANVNLGQDLTLMKPRGRTVIIGSRGTVKIDPRHLMGPESSIVGVALLTATPCEWQELSEAIVEGISAGWVNPIVNKVYSLDQAFQAHDDIINNKGAKGNLVVNVQE